MQGKSFKIKSPDFNTVGVRLAVGNSLGQTAKDG